MTAAEDWNHLPPAPPGANPIDHVCPACNAQPGRPCTAPTVAGRRAVSWVHNARRDLAEGWL